MSIDSAQCRAARAWLNWSQSELAERAQVGISTVRSLEDGSRTPIANNAGAIRRALEMGGATFLLEATDGKAGENAGTGESPGKAATVSPVRESARRKRSGNVGGARSGR
jgi:ribosome-binding protein aMBF1 (putative translation factor)